MESDITYRILRSAKLSQAFGDELRVPNRRLVLYEGRTKFENAISREFFAGNSKRYARRNITILFHYKIFLFLIQLMLVLCKEYIVKTLLKNIEEIKKEFLSEIYREKWYSLLDKIKENFSKDLGQNREFL